MKKLGVGIVGVGGIATAKHIPTLLKDERVEIRGLCDSFANSRAEKAKETFNLGNCRIESDLARMLTWEELDIIHICTPNATHAPLSIQALRAGKHVLCEKPMATSVRDAIEMDRAARSSGRTLSICANNRFRKDSWHLKQLCEQGILGNIYYARAHAVRRRGVPTWGAFLNPDLQGGGPMIDIGFHALDLAMWMMDNHSPRIVLGKTYDLLGKAGSQANPYGSWKSDEFRVEDMGVGLVQLDNGASIFLEASWLLNIRDEKTARVTLCGTKAGADMDDGLWINGEDAGHTYDKMIILDPPVIPFYERSESFGPELEMRMWIDAIIEHRPPVTQAYQTIAVMRVLEALYQSSARGQAVLLEEMP